LPSLAAVRREGSLTKVRRRPSLLLAPLLALGVSLGLPVSGLAGPIIQAVSNEARNIFPWVGQTFTAEDALIDVVGAYVVDFTFSPSGPLPATDTTIDYSLYEGLGTGETLLGSRTFAGLFEGFGGYANVSFVGIPLAVGATYTLLVSNDTFEWGVASAFSNGGALYPGGDALLPPDGGSGIPPRDLRFQVLPQVPEPGTLALLGLGLAAAAALRRPAKRG
jgi:hypothetical protein